jgi:hypothetical protein
MDQLELVLGRETYVTRGYLKTDPTFAPLRGNSRFERMVAGNIGVPVD